MYTVLLLGGAVKEVMAVRGEEDERFVVSRSPEGAARGGA